MNMTKKLFYTAFILSIISLLSTGRVCKAEGTEFQKNSEHVIEESEETRDGKRVLKLRSGQVRDRQGSPKVGEIEEGETEQVRRRIKSLALSSFGFGPFISSNVGSKHLLYGVSYGKH